MSNPNEESKEAEKLVEFARANLNFEKILGGYSRGGEFTPLFLKSAEGDTPFVWINAWLASENHIKEIEASSEHLQGRYIQRGFHPGYGNEGDSLFYEPIYGGAIEPLVLGWSADRKRIDPELSQEFERCYKLTRTEDSHKVIWNSWQESIDDVVVLERKPHDSFVLAVRSDFLRDFQFLRKRWLLIGVYGEWGKRTAEKTHIWAIDHKSEKYKLYLFGVGDGSGFKYLEVQGYFLVPIPREEGFSTTIGVGVPAGLKATVANIEFQTSEGRIKPWQVREESRYDRHASATAVFDQEVIRRYQSEPGAQVSLDNIGQLQITSNKVHLYRLTMLLGTEYVSLWLGDFVVGVPPSEWAHWHSFNIPFIGFEKQKELFAARNLFRMTAHLIRQTMLMNTRWLLLTGNDNIPFHLHHNTEKDSRSLMKALPRQADVHELIDRAKALDGLLVERIAASQIKTFLKNAGYPAKALEKLASIKLLSTFMMVVRLAEAAMGWQDDVQASLFYAQEKTVAWQNGNTANLNAEESQAIDNILRQFEILFLIHSLRLIAAHATTSELQKEISHLFHKYLGSAPEPNRYREAIVGLYDSFSSCLEKCRN